MRQLDSAGQDEAMRGPWFRVMTGCARPDVRVVCFPHAGGAASSFRDWASLVPDRTEVLAVCYPGREERFSEPHADSLGQLVDQIAGAFEDVSGTPFVLFGHSMGALVAYETAVRLEARGAVPSAVCVSGADAPGQLTETDFARADDAELVAQIMSLDGTDGDLLNHPELIDLVLAVARADYRVCEDYARATNAMPPATLLSAPIVAYSGDRDPEVDRQAIAGWSALTRSTFDMREFPGSHFYLAEHAAELVKDVLTRAGDRREPAFRLAQLLDANEPLHPPDSSGVLAVQGRIAGQTVIAYCTDATIMGGAMGMAGCLHIVDAIDTAVRLGCPVVGVWHSGGARLADGVESMDAVGRVFAAMTRASGRIPQISVVLGPAAGAAAYGPALTDIVVMSRQGRMFITGPDVVRAVTGEDIGMDDLGGAEAHGRRSGVVHVVVDGETEAYERARHLVELLARPGHFDPSVVHDRTDLRQLLPERSNVAYDVHGLLHELLDNGEFVELQQRWAPNIVIGLGRLSGRTIGVVANNPIRKGGCLDSLSAEKAARFVRMCDALGVPLVVVVDVPGYLPGVGEEWNGVIRRGAKLLHAFAEAVVPRVTLVTRKAYGGAYIAMNSRSLGATAVFAWPDAEVAVMAAEAAVGVLYRKQLAAVSTEDRALLRHDLIDRHRSTAGGVERALELGVVDEIVDPRCTRVRLATALAEALPGRGDHGNVPL